jgi:hypothetical protein
MSLGPSSSAGGIATINNVRYITSVNITTVRDTVKTAETTQLKQFNLNSIHIYCLHLKLRGDNRKTKKNWNKGNKMFPFSK